MADARKLASRAVSRCYGAMFFAVFGGAWMVLGHYALGRMSAHAGVLMGIVVVALVFTAMRIQRRGKDAGKDAFPAEEQRRNDRAFGWVNAVTWVVVFLVFVITPRIGLGDLAIPIVALVVGLHFFPMAPLYRHGANLVTGGAIIVWTAACTIMLRGDLRIGAVAAGAGIILWISAAWALRTASGLLNLAGL